MKRKYINDLGIELIDTPQGWNLNDRRQGIWAEQRELYSFDERETWSLDHTFYLWLYERLKMFDEINCINTKFHSFEFKGEFITL